MNFTKSFRPLVLRHILATCIISGFLPWKILTINFTISQFSRFWPRDKLMLKVERWAGRWGNLYDSFLGMSETLFILHFKGGNALVIIPLSREVVHIVYKASSGVRHLYILLSSFVEGNTRTYGIWQLINRKVMRCIKAQWKRQAWSRFLRHFRSHLS